jgi:hypothetical protein
MRTALLPMDPAAGVATPNAAMSLPLTWEAIPRVPASRLIAASAEFSAPQLQGMKPAGLKSRSGPRESGAAAEKKLAFVPDAKLQR